MMRDILESGSFMILRDVRSASGTQDCASGRGFVVVDRRRHAGEDPFVD